MFAFSQIEPENAGQVTRIPVPMSSYLDASFQQGFHDNAFNSVMRMTEYGLENHDERSPMIDADEANTRFGIQNHLKFDQPVRENVAQLMSDRKKAEMDRNFLLENGSSALRFLPGMAASFIAGVSNPLDFGMMFIPVVGEEKLARAASIMGRGSLRQSLARGLISSESIARSGIPAPRFFSSVLQGTVGQAAFEVPNALASLQDSAEYSRHQFVANVLAGGAFAGGLHAAVTAASHLLRNLKQSTREAILRDKINDFLTGRETNAADYVRIDDNVIKARVQEEYEHLRDKAASEISDEDVKQFIQDKYREHASSAAYLLNDGTIIKGQPMHPMLELPEDVKWEKPPVEERAWRQEGGERWVQAEGFVTNMDRFVSRDEMSAIRGTRNETLSEELVPGGEMANLSPEEEKVWYDLTTHGQESKAEATNKIRAMRKERADAWFFNRPEIKELVDRERERRINDLLQKRQEAFDPKKRFDEVQRQEIEKAKQAGRPMTNEQVEQHTHPEPEGEDEYHEVLSGVQKEIADLEQNLFAGSPSPEKAPKGVLDRAIEKVDGIIKSLENDRGMVPMDPFLIQAVGKPLLRGMFMAIREALKVTNDVVKAIDHGIEWLRNEEAKPNPNLPKGMDRRGFIGLMGKAIAAMQVPVNPASLLKGAAKKGGQVLYVDVMHKTPFLLDTFLSDKGPSKQLIGYLDPKSAIRSHITNMGEEIATSNLSDKMGAIRRFLKDQAGLSDVEIKKLKLSELHDIVDAAFTDDMGHTFEISKEMLADIMMHDMLRNNPDFDHSSIMSIQLPEKVKMLRKDWEDDYFNLVSSIDPSIAEEVDWNSDGWQISPKDQAKLPPDKLARLKELWAEHGAADIIGNWGDNYGLMLSQDTLFREGRTKMVEHRLAISDIEKSLMPVPKILDMLSKLGHDIPGFAEKLKSAAERLRSDEKYRVQEREYEAAQEKVQHEDSPLNTKEPLVGQDRYDAIKEVVTKEVEAKVEEGKAKEPVVEEPDPAKAVDSAIGCILGELS